MTTVKVDVPAGVNADLDHLARLTGQPREQILRFMVDTGVRDALDVIGLRDDEYQTETLAVNVVPGTGDALDRLAAISGDSRETVLRRVITESVRCGLVVIARRTQRTMSHGHGAFGQVLN